MGTKPILFINAVIIFPHISGEINRVLKIVYLITWDFSERKEFSLPTCTGRKLFSFKSGSCLERAISSRISSRKSQIFFPLEKRHQQRFSHLRYLKFYAWYSTPCKTLSYFKFKFKYTGKPKVKCTSVQALNCLAVS